MKNKYTIDKYIKDKNLNKECFWENYPKSMIIIFFAFLVSVVIYFNNMPIYLLNSNQVTESLKYIYYHYSF